MRARSPGAAVAGVASPAPAPVTELVRAQVASRPNAIAVAAAGDGGAWTYGQLGRRTAAIAGRLAALGLVADDRIALCLERSPELVACILGVLEAGAAYVPIDPATPDGRIQRILEDAAPRAILADPASAERLAGCEAEIIVVDGDRLATWPSPAARPAPLDLRALAYVIYTSGSTGAPKGVMVEHGALANLVGWARRGYGVGPSDRVLQFAPPSVDTSIEEILPTLAAGGTLVLRPRSLLDAPGELVSFAAEARLTILNLPTAYWHVLVDEMSRGLALPPCVERVIIGGEAAHARAVERWFEVAGPRALLLNTYGLTESCAVAAQHRLVPRDADASPIPIGVAIDGAELHVLDEDLRPVADGITGELCIGGVGLARGYLGQPELTAERFVPADGPPGARLLRTRDLARRRADGTVECLGRMDHQVKIRGHRVELGEVEATLAACPGVREAAATVEELASGDRRLVAYLVGDGIPGPDDLRELLLLDLPAHMVPALFHVAVDRLPRTTSGKIDRNALPVGRAAPRPTISPVTATEAALCRIWAPVLGVELVGRDANFLALGGHSLAALEVLSRVKAELDVELPAHVLIESPTLSAVAGAVDAAVAARALLKASRP